MRGWALWASAITVAAVTPRPPPDTTMTESGVTTGTPPLAALSVETKA
jgi:hypothetical protein